MLKFCRELLPSNEIATWNLGDLEYQDSLQMRKSADGITMAHNNGTPRKGEMLFAYCLAQAYSSL